MQAPASLYPPSALAGLNPLSGASVPMKYAFRLLRMKVGRPARTYALYAIQSGVPKTGVSSVADFRGFFQADIVVSESATRIQTVTRSRRGEDLTRLSMTRERLRSTDTTGREEAFHRGCAERITLSTGILSRSRCPGCTTCGEIVSSGVPRLT